MMRFVLLIFVVFFPIVMQAADLPDVINENEASDQQMCIDQATNECVNTECMNSPDINCTQNCQSAAAAQCQEMAEE